MHSLFEKRRRGANLLAPHSGTEADVGYKSFRRKFSAVALVVLAVNLTVGLFAWGQQRSIIHRAIDIYDTAFVSANYIHLSELNFAKFVATRRAALTQEDQAAANDLLQKTIDEIDVTIERAATPEVRAERESIRGLLASLAAQGLATPLVDTEIAAAEVGLARIGRRAQAAGLTARDTIDGFSSENDLLSLALVISSVVLAAISLAVLRRMIASMTYLANYDALTSLPKRPLLHARLTDCLHRVRAPNGGFAVLSLDLDRFKQVNDTLGHQVGDLLLIEVSNRISALLGPGDIAARFGGDEFVILKSILRDPLDAGVLARRLVGAVGAPYDINGQRILIGASIGIALAPDNGEYADDLLRNSDLALYRAKAEGKGRFSYFADEMNTAMQARRLLEIDLREALEKKQLEVHFQPLIDIADGRIIACEALVRWNHPVRGFIPPLEFLPIAEETGLIVPLGHFVLHEACAEATSWAEDISVAVNLSAVQFRTNDLVSIVVKALAETELPANRLELEITESLLIQKGDEVVKTLTALRDIGVRISLDDFGTGYSSLSYLSKFPFDKIKIDKSFVRDVSIRSDSAAIIRAITDLAGTLGKCTTAEGVESPEELEWLRKQGCQEGQGYLFSRPIPPRDLKLLLGLKKRRSIEPVAPSQQVA